tara:strand:- start:1734 stop:2840 length:1107 start_codon:yes stop_codon:yes gene_type:complete
MEINLTSPINDLGYGVAGLNILKGLVRNGCRVSYWPIGQPTARNQEDAEIINSCVKHTQLFNCEAPSLRIWHQHDMAEHIGRGERVGFPIFELNRFSEIEKHHLSSLDKIIVCSEWAKSIVESEIKNSKVYVAPLGVDQSLFSAKQKHNKEKTVFINVGKWEIRKGHDILIDAFNKAFNQKDNVELWMMNHNPFLDDHAEKEWHNLYLESSLGNKIKILPRVETHAEVSDIMSQADVGVFPSRAEGWNLEALEMMSLGKHLIMTNYSAHTEFANQENAQLIDVDETESAYDGIWFDGQGEWASIGEKQIEQLVEHMRGCHLNKDKSNTKGIETAKKFSWDNCANKIIDHCEAYKQKIDVSEIINDRIV